MQADVIQVAANRIVNDFMESSAMAGRLDHARLSVALLMRWIAAGALAMYAATPLSAADNPVWHYLSNDGEPTLMMRTPNYLSVRDRSEHIAILPVKTPVEVLETRPDPSLPGLNWSRVKALDGQHKGKEGWVSKSCVVRTHEPRPVVPSPPADAKRLQKPGPQEVEAKVVGRIESETQLRPLPGMRNIPPDAPRLPIGTRFKRISAEPRVDDFVLEFLWWEVQVLDGPLSGQKGWILDSHATFQKPYLSYDSTKAFEYAGKYCGSGNDCPTGQYGSFNNIGTLISHLTSTDCTHFMGHVLNAGGVKVPGGDAKCESGIVVRVADLKSWFHKAADNYANVSRLKSWQEAKRGDYCFLGTQNHVVLLADVPKADGGKIYGHDNSRCGEPTRFELPTCTIYRIEDHPAK